jgi:hypothetical protein
VMLDPGEDCFWLESPSVEHCVGVAHEMIRGPYSQDLGAVFNRR